MMRRPPRSTRKESSAASDVYKRQPPTVLDIGCGFGGLTLHLAQLLPNERVLGMEIRAKVTEFVRLRIVNYRQEQPNGHDYQNCGVHRTNSMKFLVNYFAKASLNKLFFCFPDRTCTPLLRICKLSHVLHLSNLYSSFQTQKSPTPHYINAFALGVCVCSA